MARGKVWRQSEKNLNKFGWSSLQWRNRSCPSPGRVFFVYFDKTTKRVLKSPTIPLRYCSCPFSYSSTSSGPSSVSLSTTREEKSEVLGGLTALHCASTAFVVVCVLQNGSVQRSVINGQSSRHYSYRCWCFVDYLRHSWRCDSSARHGRHVFCWRRFLWRLDRYLGKCSLSKCLFCEV